MANLRIKGDTSGYVDLVSPDVAGAQTINLDKIVEVNSNGYLGIGTTTPTVGLELSGTGNASRLKLIDGTDQVNFGLWDGTNYRLEGDANRKILITSYHTDGIHLGASGSSDLVVKGNKVGIGTSSPTNPLHLYANNSSELSFKMEQQEGFFEIGTNGNTTIFRNANGYQMFLNSAGNLGIGTLDADYKLTVAGDPGDDAITLLSLLHTDSDFTNGTGFNHAVNIEFNLPANRGGDTSPRTAALIRGRKGASDWYTGSADSTNFQGQLAFYTRQDNVLTEQMVINEDGHVTTPSQPSFFVKDLSYSTTGASYGTGGNVLHNIGNHYNSTNGRFTAPVAGSYAFYGSLQMFQSGSSTYVGLEFNKNSAQYGIEFVSGIVTNNGHYNDHHTQEGMAIIYCNAGDYVNIEANRGARDGIQNVFGGYLIG